MRGALLKLKVEVLNVLNPQTEIKDDYVEKVVYLLRRDFNTTEQNDIVMSIIKKLSEKRAEDMTDMEHRYSVLQKDTMFLQESIKALP